MPLGAARAQEEEKKSLTACMATAFLPSVPDFRAAGLDRRLIAGDALRSPSRITGTSGTEAGRGRHASRQGFLLLLPAARAAQGMQLTRALLFARKITTSTRRRRPPISPRFRGCNALRRYPNGGSAASPGKLSRRCAGASDHDRVDVRDDGTRRTTRTTSTCQVHLLAASARSRAGRLDRRDAHPRIPR